MTPPTPPARPTPIPRGQIALETARLALLAGGLVAALLLLLILQLWVAAIVIAVLGAGGVLTGAIGSLRQIRAAARPATVVTVDTSVWQSRNRPWLTLGEDDPAALAVELRTKGQARRLAKGRKFPAEVAGRLEPNQWVVIQMGQLTIWPAGKVQAGLTEGAFPLDADDLSIRNRLRVGSQRRSSATDRRTF